VLALLILRSGSRDKGKKTMGNNHAKKTNKLGNHILNCLTCPILFVGFLFSFVFFFNLCLGRCIPGIVWVLPVRIIPIGLRPQHKIGMAMAWTTEMESSSWVNVSCFYPLWYL
jgi:hypothetical protein